MKAQDMAPVACKPMLASALRFTGLVDEKHSEKNSVNITLTTSGHPCFLKT